MGWRRLTGAVVAAGLALLAVPVAAAADVQQSLGYETPAQAYRGNPEKTDWLGSYAWKGKQVWCVQFALKAPDGNATYQDGDELLTKGGDPLSPDVAADISYLLLRYSTTQSKDEASALAHLLHTWTASPHGDITLDPSADFRHIAYDSQSHLAALPASVKDVVQRMQNEAGANHGPWRVTATAPEKPQIIGTSDGWTVKIAKADGAGVAGVPVTVEVTDGQFDGGATSATLTTPADGSPLVVGVVPTGAKPALTVKLDSPADRPVVHVPADGDMQRIVTTGGEKKLTATAATSARTAPGAVKIAKTDAETQAAISGVSLRVTATDKAGPAAKHDDSPLVGPDGRPAVLQTGTDGTVTVPGLKTPQDICVVEVAPPKGYEENFDPNSPPTACGTVAPGQTLVLALTNKPNKPVVPIAIPAGDDEPGVIARAAVVTKIDPMAYVGLGGLVLLGSVLIGLVARHRARS
jgi:hypothetical protein